MTHGQAESGSSALLGPSEPNWAARVSANRLAGLLNLSCLLSRTTFITDNDICDNRHFLDAFRNGRRDSLYERVREFVDSGCIKFMLRDQLYRPDFAAPVDSFSDVYRSWLARDPIDAWILQDFSDVRRRYFEALDSWALNSTLRYPYRSVKESFMLNSRSAAALSDTEFMSVVRGLPIELQREYFDLLHRDWFSLTDVNTLFQSRGLTLAHPIMHYQGLLNQVTFSGFVRSSVVGADIETGKPRSEHLAVRGLPKTMRAASLDEVLERADTILDGPSLAILGRLRPDEIAQLRVSGESYFALLELSRDPDFWARSHAEFGPMLVRAATNYWSEVCAYIRTKYSLLVERPTALALFVGYDPGAMRGANDVFSLAVDAGADVAASLVPGGREIAEVARKVLKPVKLRFLFLTPTEEFRRITKVLPRSFWFRRSHPEVLPPIS
jgi:hypothetical protein